MPTPTKGPRLGGSPAHERLLLANLATELFRYGRITTTATKAKRLRPLAERMVTFAKRGDLHSRRQVLTVVKDKDVVYALFDQIAPRYTTRAGGYTRIIKMGSRKGDNAPMAIIELVEEATVAAPPARAAKSTARKATRAEAVAALAGDDDEITGVTGDGVTVITAEADDVEARSARDTESITRNTSTDVDVEDDGEWITETITETTVTTKTDTHES